MSWYKITELDIETNTVIKEHTVEITEYWFNTLYNIGLIGTDYESSVTVERINDED